MRFLERQYPIKKVEMKKAKTATRNVCPKRDKKTMEPHGRTKSIPMPELDKNVLMLVIVEATLPSLFVRLVDDNASMIMRRGSRGSRK
jgi:hypothetical protein